MEIEEWKIKFRWDFFADERADLNIWYANHPQLRQLTTLHAYRDHPLAGGGGKGLMLY